jgi:signal transduction histidine kinase
VRVWAAAGPPRSGRDWLVDSAAFLLAAGFGFGLSLLRINDGTGPAWLLLADQIAGGLGCASIWLRRRWPVELAIAMIPLTMFSETVGGASAVALFTVAVHRPVKTSVWVAGLSLLSVPVYAVVRPDAELSFAFVTVFGGVVTAAVLGWGLFVRNRRQLLASLTERAVRAEAEARLRAEHAQSQAREQIAREMHDVLGHRLSLLSVQAGALEYRRDASAAEVAGAASVIRASAHQALEDLREVIGVLRAEVSELPQPTLADVDELVDESRRAGMRVELCSELGSTGVAPVPERLGRTAYRIVQEGLTNARKHAPDAEVGVRLSGSPERGLTVELVNAVTAGARSLPGAGQGLIGLAERAMLAGGYLVGQRVDGDQVSAHRGNGLPPTAQRQGEQRQDAQRTAGQRTAGQRTAGQRTAGQRRDGQVGEEPDEWRLWAWLPWPA